MEVMALDKSEKSFGVSNYLKEKSSKIMEREQNKEKEEKKDVK